MRDSLHPWWCTTRGRSGGSVCVCVLCWCDLLLRHQISATRTIWATVSRKLKHNKHDDGKNYQQALAFSWLAFPSVFLVMVSVCFFVFLEWELTAIERALANATCLLFNMSPTCVYNVGQCDLWPVARCRWQLYGSVVPRLLSRWLLSSSALSSQSSSSYVLVCVCVCV